MPNSEKYLTREGLAAYQTVSGQTAIHFLDVGGDAILLESDGRFALIDSPGSRAAYVAEYVKEVAGGQLDFLLGTHAHADHIGGFEALLLDPEINIGRVYLKRHAGVYKGSQERDGKNRALYDRTIEAIEASGVPLAQDMPEEAFTLGEFTLTIFNGRYDPMPQDENENSMAVLAQARGLRAFLGGDINNFGGYETRVAPRIGRVDLVKAPHHGLENSSTAVFASVLRPGIVVVTDKGGMPSATVLRRWTKAGAARIMRVSEFGGIAAVFEDDRIVCYAIGA